MGAYEPDWDAIDAEVDPPEPDDVYLARVAGPSVDPGDHLAMAGGPEHPTADVAAWHDGEPF